MIRPRNWCGTGPDPKKKRPTRFDRMIELMEAQLELQKELLKTLNKHHKDAREAWKMVTTLEVTDG